MALAPVAASVGRQIVCHSHIAAIACRAPAAWRVRRHSNLSAHQFSTRIARNPWMSDDSLRRAKTIMDMWIERSERLQHGKEERERNHRDHASCHRKPGGNMDRRHSRKRDEMIKHIEKLIDLMEKFKFDKHADPRVAKQPDAGSCKHPVESTSSDLFITTYKSGQVVSSTRIPNDVIGVGARMMYLLHERGAGIADVVKRAQDMDIRGTVFEHENPVDDFKVVVSVGEANEQTAMGEERSLLANLRISTFDNDSSTLHGVTTVSGNILSIADKIIPEDARSAMKEKGVALEEIARFAADPHARGVTIVEHLDMEHGHRIIISLE